MRPVWRTVKREPRNLRGVLPLLASSIEDAASPYVFMFDASLDGYGVMRGKFDEGEVKDTLQFRERWRLLWK